MFPPVQVGRSGTRTASSADLASLHETFSRTQLLRLPEFFERTLLERLAAALEMAPWTPRLHHTGNAWATGDDPLDAAGTEWAADLHLEDAAVTTAVGFLLNDPVLFGAVETIAGCRSIRSFVPNIYKIVPEAGHYDDWHTDDDGSRLVALSVNIGRQPFQGGALRVRDRRTGAPLHEMQNATFGDAMLLGIAAHLEHSLTPVVGQQPRVALAGWFTSAPSPFPGLPA